jgi:hypothetical protein
MLQRLDCSYFNMENYISKYIYADPPAKESYQMSLYVDREAH